MVDVTSPLYSKCSIGCESASDKRSLANAVCKVEFKRLQLDCILREAKNLLFHAERSREYRAATFYFPASQTSLHHV
jgi:hypothetical protein